MIKTAETFTRHLNTFQTFETKTIENYRMAGSALKRLMAEHRQLMKNPPEGIVAGPRGDENYFEWEERDLIFRKLFF